MPDCSLFTHAWIPSQLTPTAQAAVRELGLRTVDLVSPPTLFIEFSSVLRKLVTRRQIPFAGAAEMLARLLAMGIVIVPTDEAVILRAWDIATDLGQSDTFDALGYAVAEAYDGEFWTCDQRFANAAAGRDYPRLRFVA